MLPCGALERSNNPCIESIVEPCVSKNPRDLHYVSLIGIKILKKGLGNEKEYPWAESRICVFNIVRKKLKALKLL